MAPRKIHPNKEIEYAIQYAESKGWRYKKTGSSVHAWGRLLCPYRREKDVGCLYGLHLEILILMQSRFENMLMLAHIQETTTMEKLANKTYQFTLVLKNVDEDTPHLEDSLYEAGCDDALINFREGTVYLDFDREAHSLEEAVVSAIRDVESSSIEAIVAHVGPEEWVTESEVAKRLDIKRQAVSLWIKGERRKHFPKPLMKLADKSPLWKWREIVEWLYENKIIKKEELVVNATFLENVNAVLEERDAATRNYRCNLLKKLEMHTS